MIRSSSETDRRQVIDTIVLGFAADPILRWMYPEPGAYLANVPAIVAFFGGNAFDSGTAYHTQDHAGAALWLPPGVHPEEEKLVDKLETDFEGEKKDDLFTMFEQMGEYHPSEPCWHLAFIAVDPNRQNQGIGGTLLQSTLEFVDKSGKVAYLESTNKANLSLYERHGFELMGTIPAGESLAMYPMIRKPGGKS